MSQDTQNKESTSNFLKTTFKDNLVQFVLLFAAVTLGFFAENLREENAQRKLEVKLMQSMVADLERNERLLSNQYASLTARKIASDSLAYFFNQPDMQQQTSEIYFYARKLGIYAGEYPLASRSLDQLKNSGLFTLISIEESFLMPMFLKKQPYTRKPIDLRCLGQKAILCLSVLERKIYSITTTRFITSSEIPKRNCVM